MGGMALVVLGLFVLVWIISAVVKASQSPPPGNRPGAPANRQGQNQQERERRVERTSDTDIDRFMAEIDRLRQRGEGAAGRPAQGGGGQSRPPSTVEPRQNRGEPRKRQKDRERQQRQQPASRPAPPPPLPMEQVPVLRPVTAEPPPRPQGPPPTPAKQMRPAKMARAAGVSPSPPSPVLQTLQTVLKTKQGPAAAIILAEIFGDPPGRRALQRIQSPKPDAS